MHIEINTDHNIEGHKKLTDKVQSMVEKALSQLAIGSHWWTSTSVTRTDKRAAKKTNIA